MTKLVQKSGYIQASQAGGYMKYIATREGVEKLVGNGPATKGQRELIQQLLRDYPDAKELFEYEDYRKTPTLGTASAFITMALDANLHEIHSESGYMRYIATRPRVQRRGSHGLFSAAPSVDLDAAMSQLESHEGNVWTIIYSLRREDASRLGYDHAEAWRSLLMRHTKDLAQAMKIPADHFRWYAAFHDEGHHPHIHMMVWSDHPKEGFLSRDGIAAMRSKLTNSIFRDEMNALYQRKDVAYKELTETAQDTMRELIRRMARQLCDSPIIEENMGQLVQALETTSGKKQYGYLKKPLKTLVDNIVDELAKAEKYAKILSKTIVNPVGDDGNRGQNAFFYDAAEGLLTSVILMLAEFLPPDAKHPQERRHIVSVFMLVQDLLEPSGTKGKSHFQILMEKLPPEHKARWFAGAALNSADQAMASVMSTVLSRLNAFLDSELEQILCFDSAMDAEQFASEKSAIFLILPEEDTTKNFMAGLMIQNLSRELFAVADENGGKLKNRVVLFCDEFGTMPPFDILSLFSAGRSRRLTLVPIIQSLAQLEKNYGKEGCEIIADNCQDTIFGGFAPNSQTAEVLSKALGSRTVLSGSVSRGKNDPSQSLQMMERALLTPDELKSIPKGSFIVMKTGTHPMRTRLRLFLDWGITFGEPYTVPERANREVAYANRVDLEHNLPQSNKFVEQDATWNQTAVKRKSSRTKAFGDDEI